MDPISTPIKIVLVLEAALGLTIVAIALIFYAQTSTQNINDAKTVYDLVVLQTLLTLFKLAVTAVLAWVFGKPLIAAFATRLSGKRNGST